MRALPIALALLCVLAGCNGFGPNAGGNGQATDRTSVTPADVPRDEHGGTIAPGLTRDRLVNESALAAAHRAALENESLTARWTGTSVTLTRDRTVRLVPYSTVTRYGPARQRAHRVTSYEETRRNVSRREFWIGPDRALSLTVSNGTRAYTGVRSMLSNSIREVSLYAPGLLGADRVTVERAGTTERGDVRYRVQAVEPSVPEQTAGARDRFETRNVSLAMTVDERGVIHRYRFSYELRQRDGGEWHRVRTVYELGAVGETTVDRPDWYDDAVAALENRSTTSE